VAVAKEISRLVKPIIQGWIARVYAVDPTTNNLLAGVREERAAELRYALASTLMTGENRDEPYNVSAYDVVIGDPATGTFLDNGQIPVSIPFIPLGEVESVTVDIAAQGTITIA
jgi:hypothetical protein